jgi:hypothetical protein
LNTRCQEVPTTKAEAEPTHSKKVNLSCAFAGVRLDRLYSGRYSGFGGFLL